MFFVFLSFIHWIAIYPVDRVIHPLNNQALGEERMWQLLACRTSFHRTFDCRVGGLVCIMLSCIRLFNYPPPARCVNGHQWTVMETKNMLVETPWLTSLSFRGGGGGEESSSVPNRFMSQKSYLGTGFDGHHFCTLFTLIVLGEFRLYSFVNLLYYFYFYFFSFWNRPEFCDLEKWLESLALHLEVGLPIPSEMEFTLLPSTLMRKISESSDCEG